MKTAIMAVGLYVAIVGHAFCQTNSSPQPLVAAHRDPMKVVLPDPLTTTSGKTYKSIKLVQVYPSYITISCLDDDYVMNLDNVRLENLSTNLQVQFGYDPTNAMLYDAMENKQAALFSTPSSMTPSERRWYDYNQILLRKQDEKDKAEAATAAAKQQEADDLKRREVEAKEKAAQAAMIQAQNPPIMIQQQQQQQQQ